MLSVLSIRNKAYPVRHTKRGKSYLFLIHLSLLQILLKSVYLRLACTKPSRLGVVDVSGEVKHLRSRAPWRLLSICRCYPRPLCYTDVPRSGRVGRRLWVCDAFCVYSSHRLWVTCSLLKQQLKALTETGVFKVMITGT